MAVLYGKVRRFANSNDLGGDTRGEKEKNAIWNNVSEKEQRSTKNQQKRKLKRVLRRPFSIEVLDYSLLY